MKVKVGQTYTFDPVAWDIIDPKTNCKKGDKVRVVKLHGAPPPNTMGCCHIEDLNGNFLGLVNTNSLQKVES